MFLLGAADGIIPMRRVRQVDASTPARDAHMNLEVTAFGWLFIPICLMMLRRPEQLLPLLVIGSIFDAAAVVNVKLGGFSFSVQPAFAVGILFLLVILIRYLADRPFGNEGRVLYVFWPIVMLCLGAMVSAWVLPRIFAGQVYVWPQRMEPGIQDASVPLYSSSGNITQVIYLVVAVLLAIFSACVIEKMPALANTLLKCYLISGTCVFIIGAWQLLNKITGIFFPHDFLYSNTNWADNSDQTFGAGYRISGSFSEPSFLSFYTAGVEYAAFWLIVRSRRKNQAATVVFVLMVILTILCTSTTGYAALALGLPLAFLFGLARPKVFGRLGIVIVIGSVAVIMIAFVVSKLFPGIVGMAQSILDDTLQKGNSESYNIRSAQDWESVLLVLQTHGLGTGWGSVRASSFVTTVIGATGVWGPALIVWFIMRLRRTVKASLRSAARHAEAVSTMEALAASLVGMGVAAAIAKPDLVFTGFWINLGACVGVSLRLRRDALQPGRVDMPLEGLGAEPALETQRL